MSYDDEPRGVCGLFCTIFLAVLLVSMLWMVPAGIMREPTTLHIALGCLFVAVFVFVVVVRTKFEFTKHYQTVNLIENIAAVICFLIWAYFTYFVMHAVPRPYNPG
jgi:hypothetical protein